MFTITITKLDCKKDNVSYPSLVETLAEAEVIALSKAEIVFGINELELVYIEDLDYYVYDEFERIARLTIQPIYAKVRTK